MTREFKVTDVVYKVVNDWQGGLVVGRFQILRIMKHGRLICFRRDKADNGKAAHNFYPGEVFLTKEEAVENYHKGVTGKIFDLYKEIGKLESLLKGKFWNEHTSE